MPLFNGGIIEIGELHRALELIGAVSGEKHDGGMGFDASHRFYAVRIAPGIAEKGQKLSRFITLVLPIRTMRWAGASLRICTHDNASLWDIVRS
jgi:hypothetical protein